MEYTINDLGSCLTQFLILEIEEKRLRKNFHKTVRDKEVLYSDATYLDTEAKIIAFQVESTFFIRKLNKLFKTLVNARNELKSHCLIIPKGHVFKITHSSGIFNMSRKAGFIELQGGYTEEIHLNPGKEIRYIFPEIIVWSDY